MKFKDYKSTTVKKNVFLDSIEPYKTTGLPANAILFKGRCGIGGTTMELEHKRHSIIVVPTVAPIRGKLDLNEGDECLVKEDIFPLMSSLGLKRQEKIKRLEAYLNSDIKYKKIMTTPDSFDCIIEAMKRTGKLQWLYDEFFLLLDECHSFATEKFRKKIIVPFKYMWEFKSKCLISATPFEFSDPRFEQLERHEIIVGEKLGKIKLITTDDIKRTVHKILNEPENFPGNVHIFYNSVVQMSECVREIIEEKGSLDCNIFCSGSEENFVKLDDLRHLYREKPGDYKKFNFYTTRYFEAWDLYDPTDVTIILLTDAYSTNSAIGISNKGVQSLGRYRGIKKYVKGEPYEYKEPYQIVHITNHRENTSKLGMEYFREKHDLYAIDAVTKYNEHLENAKNDSKLANAKFKSIAQDYAEIEYHTNEAELNHTLIDQWVNAEVSNEEYNHIDFIKDAWKRSNYEVEEFQLLDEMPPTKHLAIAQQIKIGVQMFEEFSRKKGNFLFINDLENTVKRWEGYNENFALAYKAYHMFGKKKLEEVRYHKKEILALIYEKYEEEIIGKIQKEVRGLFELTEYKTSMVKEMLQIIYDRLEYVDKKGNIKTAKAIDINQYCDVKYSKNKSTYTIKDYNY